MKKLLGSLVVLTLFLPPDADAELLKNLKLSGALDIDAVAVNNVDDLDKATYDRVDTVQTRLMLRANWDLLDDVHSRVTLTKNDRSWSGTSGGSGGSSQNLNTLQTAIAADEAYVKIDKLFGGLDTTLGRQFYGKSGDLVIYFGPSGSYGLPTTTLDAARFDWSGETFGLTFLAAKTAGKTAKSAGPLAADAGDKNLRGIDVHIKPLDGLSGSAYLYNQNTMNSAAGGSVKGNDHLYVAGVKAKVTRGPVWLKAELAKNFGNNRPAVTISSITPGGHYAGWALLVNGGIKADVAAAALTVWGEFGVGSGGTTNRNFQPINGNYQPGTIFGRFAASGLGGAFTPAGAGFGSNNSLSNLVVLGGGVKATPTALGKLTASVSLWNMRFKDLIGAKAAAGSASIGKKNLGTEYDLDLTWNHSDDVSVSAGAAALQPGGYFADVARLTGAGLSRATATHLGAKIRF